MKLEIMKREDIEILVDIYIDTFSKEPWNDNFDNRNLIVDFFNNHFNNNYFIGYTYVDNNKIIGMSLGMKKPWESGMEYYIDQFLINYEFQNKGYGSIFLKEIERDLKSKNINAIILNTEKDYPSYKFYIKNGLEEIEELKILVKNI